MEHQKKELIKNTIIIGIGKFSSQVVMFLMLPLYTSCLNATEYGIYDTLVAIATFIIPIITLLFEESMFRFLIEYKDKIKRQEVISITTLFHIIGIIIFLLIYLIIIQVFEFQFKYWFLFYVIVNVVHGLGNALSRGMSEIKLYSFSNFLTNILVVILNVLTIAILKFGVQGLFISYIIGNIVASLLVFVKLRIFKYLKFKKIDVNLFKEMLKYSIPLIPNSLSWSIINVSDRVMLTAMYNPSANGIYSVSNKFPQIMGSIYNFFSTAWKESASKTLGDEKYYDEIYYNILKILFIITIGLLSVLPISYNLFVGNEFSSSYLYVPILIIAMMFSNISEYFSGIFIAYKDTKCIGITTLISAVVNFLINIILIKRIGIWAAAFSTLISTILVAGIRRIFIKKYVDIHENKKLISKYIILIIISTIFYYLDNQILHYTIALIMILILIFDNKEFFKDIIIKFNKKGEKNELR